MSARVIGLADESLRRMQDTLNALNTTGAAILKRAAEARDAELAIMTAPSVMASIVQAQRGHSQLAERIAEISHSPALESFVAHHKLALEVRELTAFETQLERTLRDMNAAKQLGALGERLETARNAYLSTFGVQSLPLITVDAVRLLRTEAIARFSSLPRNDQDAWRPLVEELVEAEEAVERGGDRAAEKWTAQQKITAALAALGVVLTYLAAEQQITANAEAHGEELFDFITWLWHYGSALIAALLRAAGA